MDFEQLEHELAELQQRHKVWVKPINETFLETTRKIREVPGYTSVDREHEMEAVSRQQHALYNPRLAIRPILEAMIAFYITTGYEERILIRAICHQYNVAHNDLIRYIWECAECLETSADGDILRLALIAASIENGFPDYRDTEWYLSELAVKTREAGIDAAPYAKEAAELAIETKDGYYSIRKRLEEFPTYTLTAVRFMD